MTDPLETLYWHDMDALKRKERSDESFIAQRCLVAVENRPAPLEMTDTERLDWFGEYCEKHEYVYPTPTKIGHFVLIDSMGQRTVEASFRDAIDSAMAKWKEANE